MKSKRSRRVMLLSLMLIVLSILPVYADSTQPGSADDPLVTKSYVDQAIAQRLGGATPSPSGTTAPSSLTEVQVREIVRSELAQVVTPTQSPAPTITPLPSPTPAGTASGSTPAPSANLEVVVLQAGQTLMAGAGTEFIVRTGKTIAVSSDENGIPDVTGGKDIPAGSAVDLNHLLIFPREGRGIKPDPKEKGDIYVMVRGPYLLVKS